jgi:phosphomevalonate kinase
LFSARSGELSWHAGGKDFALFEQVWAATGMSSLEPLSFTLDTRAFRENGIKTGVGSSAALTVALTAAMSGVGGADDAGVARRAHREFQGGSGSGVDIATSLAGGVIEYRIGDNTGFRVAWPAGLCYAVFWSGIAADTRSKLERLQKQLAPAARAALGEAAEQFAAVFGDGSVPRILDELSNYTGALRQFDAESGLGIFAAGHARMSDSATAHSAVYKPCGAGGGDVGVAVAAAEDSLASFTDVAVACGFRRLDMKLDMQGVMLTEEEQ